MQPQNQTKTNQNPRGFFVETDNLILKFTWKCKGLRIAKTTLKMKNKGRGPA